MPKKTHEKREPEPLKAKATRIAARKYNLRDALLVDVARDSLRPTGDTIYRFRVVSAMEANGAQHEIVLDQSGAELDLEEISRRDNTIYFATDLKSAAPAAGGLLLPAAKITIDPTENKLELDQGETTNETITVTIPAKASVVKADVYFLADTTGSMGSILNAVKAGASNILAALNALGLDFAYGVGNYRDFPNDAFAFKHQLNPTNVAANVTAAINGWTATGGADLPEASLFALHKLAEGPGGAIGWRAGSKRIVVWFGDAPGHDPICQAISGEPANITEASVTAKLVPEKITILAISTSTPGLDDDPKFGAFDYNAACGAPGGSPGQGTNIANATGGKFVSGINPGNISQTIIDLVKSAVASINNVKLVPSGGSAPFVTSISPGGGYGPLAADVEHKLEFKVTFTGVVPCKDKEQMFTGTLDVVVDGVVVAAKRVEIKIPPCKELRSYSVKFICGIQPECSCECVPIRPGIYATEITIHNYHDVEVAVLKRFVPVVFAGAASGREPRVAQPRAVDKIKLPPHAATMDDCCRITELLFGGPPPSPIPITIGFLEITSTEDLSVTAVYTVSDPAAGSVSIDVEQTQPATIKYR